MVFIYLRKIVFLVKKCSNGLNGFDQVKGHGERFSIYNDDARLSVCVCVPKSDILDFFSEKLSLLFIKDLRKRYHIFDSFQTIL